MQDQESINGKVDRSISKINNDSADFKKEIDKRLI
mgnify:CR=1 FL=1